MNNYKAEFGLKQHLICSAKLAYYVHFHLSSPFNPQLTPLYCNFSNSSKKGPAKYFWDTKKWGELFLKFAPTSKSGRLSPHKTENVRTGLDKKAVQLYKMSVH